MNTRPRRAGLVAPGTLLGVGLGGFLDGIVFHQVLQWHNMLSSVVPPTDMVSMRYNMRFDGLFHLAMWLTIASGVGLLWRAGSRRQAPWSVRPFVGSLLLGFGLFHVAEGLVDHRILGIHHVHPGVNELAWDLALIAFGAVLALAGFLLLRADHPLPRRGISAPELPAARG